MLVVVLDNGTTRHHTCRDDLGRREAREVSEARLPDSPISSVSARHDDAACRDEDPELFFPISSTGPAILQLQQAKAVCAGCAAQSRCFEWAVTAGAEHGVWGDTLPCGTGDLAASHLVEGALR